MAEKTAKTSAKSATAKKRCNPAKKVSSKVEYNPDVQNDTRIEVFTPKEFNLNDIVTVRNGFQGTLIYKSKKTGEIFTWDEFGDEQDMEVSELRSARSSSKAFFENNWWLFDDPDIIGYLGMSRYYANALGIDDFDSLFELPVDDMTARIAKLTSGQKRSVAYRAKELIAEGEIDSNKKIRALEDCLGVQLVEH